MKHALFLLCVVIIVVTSDSQAADAYIVRFNAQGRQSGNIQVQWLDDVIFFNTNENSAVVRILGVSNGSLQADAPQLLLPPKRPISINNSPVVNVRWSPNPAAPIWVMHVDIPAGVVVESRDEFYVATGIPELPPTARGKVSMPIFKELAPAGKPQIHLGTDLSATASRLNVGIYNAGNESASALIEVRRTCDDSLVDSRVLTLPPNTVLQATGLTGGPDACTSRATPPWMRYTVVSVSQPSFSFVSNINENVVPQQFESGLIPPVGLAVAHNSGF